MIDWRVNETHKRSLLKAVSFRIIEVIVDALILSIFLAPELAVGLAVLFEGICLGLHYIFERVWNRIQYGREILDRGMAQSRKGQTIKRGNTRNKS